MGFGESKLWKYIAGVISTTINATVNLYENLIVTDTSDTGSAFAGDVVYGSVDPADATNPLTQISETGAVPFASWKCITSAEGAILGLKKTRGTYDAQTIAADNDVIGGIIGYYHDGNNASSWGAAIRMYVDGTPGANDTPGRIEFQTTPIGSDSGTTRMEIDESGRVKLGVHYGQANSETLYVSSLVTVGGNIAYNMLIGNGDNTVGDEVGMRWKAGAAPGSNRAKGLIAYKSTTTFGRGDWIFYQDQAADANPVLNTDLEVLRIKSNGDVYFPIDSQKTYWGGGQDAYIEYDGTDMKIVTNVVAPSDLVVDCGTNKTIELAKIVWDDLRTPATAIRLGGAAPPTETAYKGGMVLAFPSNASKIVYPTFQIPHSYKEGSDIVIHIHWTIPVSGAGVGVENVKWDLTYSWANKDDAFPGETADTMTIDVQNDVIDDHMYDAWATISGAGKIISSCIICSIARDVTVGNDYANSAYLISVDLHHQIDTIGSRQELIK